MLQMVKNNHLSNSLSQSLFGKCAKERIFDAAPAHTPTRPPIQDTLCGWSGGGVGRYGCAKAAFRDRLSQTAYPARDQAGTL